jgi:P-type Ca2+ transporter type 2B
VLDFDFILFTPQPPTPDLLKRAPYDRSQPLLSAIMLRQILGHAFLQITVMFVLVFAGEKIFDIESGRSLGHSASPTQHFTIVFNAFIMMQLFNEINARKIHGEWNVFRNIFNNYVYIIVLATTLFLQVIIVEYGSFAFRTTALTWWQWVACVVRFNLCGCVCVYA